MDGASCSVAAAATAVTPSLSRTAACFSRLEASPRVLSYPSIGPGLLALTTPQPCLRESEPCSLVRQRRRGPCLALQRSGMACRQFSALVYYPSRPFTPLTTAARRQRSSGLARRQVAFVPSQLRFMRCPVRANSLSRYLSLSLSHTYTHSLSHPLCLPLSLSLTHTYSLFISNTKQRTCCERRWRWCKPIAVGPVVKYRIAAISIPFPCPQPHTPM